MNYQVLLCVSGMSPAIITETLFALLTESKPYRPHEIHIVTTTQGKAKILKDLLSPQGGCLEALLADYWPTNLPPPVFDTHTIHVIHNMDDINSDASNRLAGDFIFQVFHGIQQGTLLRRNPDQQGQRVQIHASIAGGRKTMSFLMGHAFSLLAEPQDELSHVLVNKPFEDPSLGFFFPPKVPRLLEASRQVTGQQSSVSTADAQVNLGRITALKLGKQWMPAQWLKAVKSNKNKKTENHHRMTLELAVRLANAREQPERMELQVTQSADGSNLQGFVQICGISIALSPMEFAVLAFFAMLKVQAQQVPERMQAQAEDLPVELWEELTRDFRHPFTGDKQPDTKTLISRLHSEMRDCLGACAEHYMLEPIGKKQTGINRPLKLNTNADLIDFVGDDEWDVDWWSTIKKTLASPAGLRATQHAWAKKSA
ncbi:MAG: hypothetical protein RLZZ352_2413 [Pseudomonadota bacterium]